eukprot:358736-Chlamydomonas_euryale.AAC.2
MPPRMREVAGPRTAAANDVESGLPGGGGGDGGGGGAAAKQSMGAGGGVDFGSLASAVATGAASASQSRLLVAAVDLLGPMVHSAGSLDVLADELSDFLSGRPGGGGGLTAVMDAVRLPGSTFAWRHMPGQLLPSSVHRRAAVRAPGWMRA